MNLLIVYFLLDVKILSILDFNLYPFDLAFISPSNHK